MAEIAEIIMESCPCDQGHYGSTYYYCGNCYKKLKKSVEPKDSCPKCKAIFSKIIFTVHGGFGGSDF